MLFPEIGSTELCVGIMCACSSIAPVVSEGGLRWVFWGCGRICRKWEMGKVVSAHCVPF